ncbi:hypothetical protein [Rhizobium gallicum]|uniref:hypothetical protein n=1 Tax=Rhizobium gallicum TaxID=56730 RepID=UPI00093C3A3E|nr:hypothetical protein [Rhizobium gallicum]
MDVDAWPKAVEAQRASLRRLIERDRDDPADIGTYIKRCCRMTRRGAIRTTARSRAFMVEFPDGVPAAAVPDHLMDFHGDEIAGGDPKLQWMLVNIVLNAMMYFSQDHVDVFESRFEGQWGRALKPNVYDCGQPRMFKRQPPFIAGNWMHHQRTGAPGISTIWNMPRWGVERPTAPRRGESEAKVVELFGRNAKV